MPRTSTVPVRLLSRSLICFQDILCRMYGTVTHPSLLVSEPQSWPLQRSFKWSFWALSNWSSGLPWLLCAYLWTAVWTFIFCFSILIFLFHFSLPFASHSMTFSGTLSFNLIYFFLFSLPDILKTSLVTQPISGWCLHHKLALAHQAHHSLRCSSPNHCDLSLTRTHQFVRVLEQKIRVPRSFESSPVTSTLKFKIEPGVE